MPQSLNMPREIQKKVFAVLIFSEGFDRGGKVEIKAPFLSIFLATSLQLQDQLLSFLFLLRLNSQSERHPKTLGSTTNLPTTQPAGGTGSFWFNQVQSCLDIRLLPHDWGTAIDVTTIVIWIVAFSSGGYKIRKIFA